MKVLTRLCPLLDNEEIELKDFRKWYKKYCSSIHFKTNVKKPCLERWNYQCPFCGKKAKTAHHFKGGYLNLWKENIVYDVIAVCNRCHATLHDKFPPSVKKQRTINNQAVQYDFDKLQEMSITKRKLPIDINMNVKEDVCTLQQSVINLGKKKKKLKILNVG